MKTRTKIIALVAAKVLVTLVAGSVVARAETGIQSFRTACMGDYHRHCFGVRPGGGRILACLGKHMGKLTPACARTVMIGALCVDDYKNFCPNVSPQGGELRACLEQNKDRLSHGCASLLDKTSKR